MLHSTCFLSKGLFERKAALARSRRALTRPICKLIDKITAKNNTFHKFKIIIYSNIRLIALSKQIDDICLLLSIFTHQ